MEIVSVDSLGAKSSIILTADDLDKSAAQLKRQQVAFQRASESWTDANNKTTNVEMIVVNDPDSNIIRIESTH